MLRNDNAFVMPVEFYSARVEPRDDYYHQIEYILDPTSNDELYKAVTINISESGIGLYVFKPLAEGQQITIKNVIRGSHKTGTVRWNKKVNENIYRIGVTFDPCKSRTKDNEKKDEAHINRNP